MMRSKWLFFMLAGLVWAACNPTKKSGETPSTPETTAPNGNTKPSTDTKKPVKIIKPVIKTLLLTHQRGSCFGKCPVFKLEIGTDGTALYTGTAHVSRLGTYTTKISAEGLKMIQEKAQSIGFFGLNTQYPSADAPKIPDLPQSSTFLKMGGQERQVTILYDGPQPLVSFQQWLETYVESLNWLKIED